MLIPIEVFIIWPISGLILFLVLAKNEHKNIVDIPFSGIFIILPLTCLAGLIGWVLFVVSTISDMIPNPRWTETTIRELYFKIRKKNG